VVEGEQLPANRGGAARGWSRRSAPSRVPLTFTGGLVVTSATNLFRMVEGAAERLRSLRSQSPS